ncbi:hypothetical protein DdX_07552 [Ditylenchus destructor]|uniref:Uncharacterized protein n=1 Tax=Ditylenchus destructor TaxID=166010 RepID=A0AAD4R889_9BILA|nr:hypothetical protein DdX_07552 [Ditylenchus destructor]
MGDGYNLSGWSMGPLIRGIQPSIKSTCPLSHYFETAEKGCETTVLKNVCRWLKPTLVETNKEAMWCSAADE